jgi:hypothetical protein
MSPNKQASKTASAISIAFAIMIWPSLSCRNSRRFFGLIEAQFSLMSSQPLPRPVVE